MKKTILFGSVFLSCVCAYGDFLGADLMQKNISDSSPEAEYAGKRYCEYMYSSFDNEKNVNDVAKGYTISFLKSNPEWSRYSNNVYTGCIQGINNKKSGRY